MTGTALLFLVLGLGLIGWIAGRARAAAFVRSAKAGPRGTVNSLPYYHGWFVAICAIAPALAFMFIWQSISPSLVTNMVLSAPAAADLPQEGFARAAILSEARAIAQGFQATAFQGESERLVPLYKGALAYYKWIGAAGMKARMPIINNGAVSPKARAMPIIVPVNMPGRASGSTWWNTTCTGEAPMPKAASRIDGGTDLTALRPAMTMTGIVISASVKPPTNADDRGIPNRVRKTARPSRPKIILQAVTVRKIAT